MSNDNLMLLFNAGIFLISLLTFIILLIEKIAKKIVALLLAIGTTIFTTKNLWYQLPKQLELYIQSESMFAVYFHSVFLNISYLYYIKFS